MKLDHTVWSIRTEALKLKSCATAQHSASNLFDFVVNSPSGHGRLNVADGSKGNTDNMRVRHHWDPKLRTKAHSRVQL